MLEPVTEIVVKGGEEATYTMPLSIKFERIKEEVEEHNFYGCDFDIVSAQIVGENDKNTILM